jgi:hypothetical protein
MDGGGQGRPAGFWRQVEAEVADQIDQIGNDRSRARLALAAEGLLRAAAIHELEPDDTAFWEAVATQLRRVAG